MSEEKNVDFDNVEVVVVNVNANTDVGSESKKNKNEHTRTLRGRADVPRTKRRATPKIKLIPSKQQTKQQHLSSIIAECIICGKKLLKSAIAPHMFNVHNQTYDEDEEESSVSVTQTKTWLVQSAAEIDRTIYCKMCDVTFARMTEMDAHIRRVHCYRGPARNLFHCKNCNLGFRTVKQLCLHACVALMDKLQEFNVNEQLYA